nr:unnamed protein product [Callosobruchus analis]
MLGVAKHQFCNAEKADIHNTRVEEEIDRNMTSQSYISNVLQPIKQLQNPIFQQDNARPHTAAVTRDFPRQANVTTLPKPARSPDLSLTGHVWDMRGRRLGRSQAVMLDSAAERNHKLLRCGFSNSDDVMMPGHAIADVDPQQLDGERGTPIYRPPDDEDSFPVLHERELHSLHRNIPALRRRDVDTATIKQHYYPEGTWQIALAYPWLLSYGIHKRRAELRFQTLALDEFRNDAKRV